MADQPLPPALTEAGFAMLQCAVEEFLHAGVSVMTQLDARLRLTIPQVEVKYVDQAAACGDLFDQLAVQADAVLVIAPELGGLLERWVARLETLATRNLGCGSRAVSVCADKLALCRCLDRAGVPTPKTVALAEGEHVSLPLPWVVKPRLGAGCERTMVWRRKRDITLVPLHDDLIIQPWIEGVSASVSCMVRGQGIEPVLASQQLITGKDQLVYEGGRTSLDPPQRQRAEALAERAIDTVMAQTRVDGQHDVRGWVGVDLILAPDPMDDVVIEINPRLTVSFTGASRLCRTGLAAAMLDPHTPIELSDEQIHYSAIGEVFTETPW